MDEESGNDPEKAGKAQNQGESRSASIFPIFFPHFPIWWDPDLVVPFLGGDFLGILAPKFPVFTECSSIGSLSGGKSWIGGLKALKFWDIWDENHLGWSLGGNVGMAGKLGINQELLLDKNGLKIWDFGNFRDRFHGICLMC